MKAKEKSFERRAELIKTALEEFITKNYEEASLNSIIKTAGISKGTFYYHFQDKQALYLFLLKTAADAKMTFLKEKTSVLAMKTADFSKLDMFEKFKIQARIGAEFFAAYPEYYKLGLMFLKEKGSPIYAVAKDYLGNTSEGMIEAMIKAAIDNQDFRDDFSPDFIVKVLSFLFMQFDQIFHSNEDLEIGKMLENLDNYVDFMKYGLGRDKKTAAASSATGLS